MWLLSLPVRNQFLPIAERSGLISPVIVLHCHISETAAVRICCGLCGAGDTGTFADLTVFFMAEFLWADESLFL